MHSLIGIIGELGSAEQAQKANEYAAAIGLEDVVRDKSPGMIADEAVAVVSFRLKDRRGTTVAPINNASSLRVDGVSINTWAKWRKPGQDPATTLRPILAKATELLAQRLHLQPSQVTVKIDVDSMNNISRIVFHFAESVTRVPTN